MIRKHIPAKVITLHTFDELTKDAQRQAVINYHNIDDSFIDDYINNQIRMYIDCDCGADGWSVLYPLWEYIQENNIPFVEVDRDVIDIKEYYVNVYGVFIDNVYIYDFKEVENFITCWLKKSNTKIKYGLYSFYIDCIQGVRIDKEGTWIELNCDSFYDENRKRIIKYINNITNKLEKLITKHFVEVINEEMTNNLQRIVDYYLYNRDEVLEEVIDCYWLPKSDKSLFFEDGTPYEKYY